MKPAYLRYYAGDWRVGVVVPFRYRCELTRRWRVVWLCCCVATFGFWSQAVSAQDVDMLWREFDARVLTVEEKRLLQVGLTAAGPTRG